MPRATTPPEPGALLLVAAVCGCSSPEPGSLARPRPDTGPASVELTLEGHPERDLTLAEETPLPATAPAFVLLAALDASGAVTVEGRVDADLYADLDDPEDSRDAFRYTLCDDQGGALFQRTLQSPVLVRDWLAHYSEASGYDILSIFPQLGHFPVVVPELPSATSVLFEIRDGDGVYQPVGEHVLGSVPDEGTSEVVVATETLWSSGDPEHRLDVVLLGDGYTEAQLDQWREDAASLALAILDTPPLSAWSGALNIHRVDAVSNESGASFDCVDECVFRDTAFGSVFPLYVVNAITGSDYTRSTVIQQEQWEVARAASTVPWDLAVVVVNSPQDGGMSVHYATVSKGEGWVETGVHELGHLLGLLGDEYVIDECIVSESLGLPGNVARDPLALPWDHWLELDERVGAWQGAYNCEDLYRPAETCMMRDSGEPFCPVCAEMLVRRIFRLVDPLDRLDASVAGGALQVEAAGPWPAVSLEIALDGVTVAEGTLDAPPTVALPETWGRHTVEVRAALETDEVVETWGDLEQVRAWSY